MINQYNFQVGDVVYVPLYGIFRHYGVVVEAGEPALDDDFLRGKKITRFDNCRKNVFGTHPHIPNNLSSSLHPRYSRW